MNIVVFTDCDDTLFKTAGKLKNEKLEECEVASFLSDGTPSGYRTPKLKALMAWISTGKVIPVTARSRDVLARCHVPQVPAICSNGGHIIKENGERDQEWHSHISEKAKLSGIEDVYENICGKMSDDYRHWIVFEDNIPIYIVIKSNISSDFEIKEATSKIDAIPENWKIHKNGNNLAILPDYISKRIAVKYIKDQYLATDKNYLFVGIGDSVSDLGFMEECDFSMYPNQSQISNLVSQNHSW